MATINDAIFHESLNCLARHKHAKWGDRVLLDVFNRLLAKDIRPPGWTHNTHLDIQPKEISSRKEKWTTEQLAKLDRGHSRTEGEDFDCPIIVAEYEGKQRLLDGTTRINRWIKAGDTRVHDVSIHAIAGVTRPFVELPSAVEGA